MLDNTCKKHTNGDWSSECNECNEWDSNKLRDETTDEMFEHLCKVYHLKTGDMSPEDTFALDGIIKRFIKTNRA
jgi:hypothetical protein